MTNSISYPKPSKTNLISLKAIVPKVSTKVLSKTDDELNNKNGLLKEFYTSENSCINCDRALKGLLHLFLTICFLNLGLSQGHLEVDGDISIGGKIKTEIYTGNTLIGLLNGVNINDNAAYNTMIGYEAGRDLTKGDANIFIGYWAGLISNGDANIYMGSQTGKLNKFGFKNTFIGDQSGLISEGHSLTLIGAESSTTHLGVSESIAIGYGAEVGCDNCAVIGGVDDLAVDVGIGTSSPSAPLHIKNKLDGAFNPEAIVIEDAEDSDKWEISSLFDQLYFERNGAGRASIDAATGAYNQLSDRRLKENMVELNGTLAELSQFNTYRFTYKNDNSQKMTIGVIAQELNRSFPELVNDSSEYLSVNYDGLAVIAIQAIKEQQEIIADLRKENLNIKSRMSSIENQLNNYTQNE